MAGCVCVVGACMAGGIHGRGACMAGGVCMAGGTWQWGACMSGGVYGRGRGRGAWKGVCVAGGLAWQGDMHGRRGMHGRGVSMAGVCVARYYEIRSMSGRYASYWNAFLS